MLVEPLDLRSEHSPRGQLRQRVHGKELDRIGFVTARRTATGQLAQEEKLVDVMNSRWMWMTVLVDQCCQLYGMRPVARLLENLALDCLGGGIVHIHPTARQRPAAVGALAHQQHTIVPEHAAAHVDLRGHVAAFAREECARVRRRDLELRGQELSHQLGESLVALAIERIAREGEPVVRNGLRSSCPLEQTAAATLAHERARRRERVERARAECGEGAGPGRAAARWLLRTTSFSPDQVSSTAHTLISTSPSGRATSRTTSSLMSVATREAFFGQLTQIVASSRIARRAASSRCASAARAMAKRCIRSVASSIRRTVRTPGGSGATSWA